jgi:hypothetical protein
MIEYTPKEARARTYPWVQPSRQVVYTGGSMTRVTCPHCASKISIYVPPTSGKFTLYAKRNFGTLAWTRHNPATGTFQLHEGETPFVTLYVHPAR